MSYTFILTTAPNTPFLEKIQILLQNTPPVTTDTAYNTLMHDMVMLAKKSPTSKNQGPLFENELKEATRAYPLSETTPWGGVVLKIVDVENDHIQKFLVIKQYGILGFEIHTKKVEKLHILEGTCLLISSKHKEKDWEKGRVEITLGKPGNKMTLEPEDEHGIIALSNCVIEETSTNHLDDLIYIYPASQIR